MGCPDTTHAPAWDGRGPLDASGASAGILATVRVMTPLRTGFALFSAAVALVVACGGTAQVDGTGGGGAGSGAAGASSAGAAGAAGSGAGSMCEQVKQPGSCDAFVPSFWHNPKTGLCEPFVYGGCGGNGNRFATRDDCLAACPGGGKAWGACQKDSECTLTTTGCCQGCEPLANQDYLALNAAFLEDEFATRPCTPLPACAPCPPSSELTATGKYYKPVCRSGQCTAVDLRESPVSECQANDDCRLRAGVACCERCQGGFVAVNSGAEFCPEGPEPCPKCAAFPPQGIVSQCTAGRCVVAKTPD